MCAQRVKGMELTRQCKNCDSTDFDSKMQEKIQLKVANNFKMQCQKLAQGMSTTH